jgi:hypothetical protein
LANSLLISKFLTTLFYILQEGDFDSEEEESDDMDEDEEAVEVPYRHFMLAATKTHSSLCKFCSHHYSKLTWLFAGKASFCIPVWPTVKIPRSSKITTHLES